MEISDLNRLFEMNFAVMLHCGKYGTSLCKDREQISQHVEKLIDTNFVHLRLTTFHSSQMSNVF